MRRSLVFELAVLLFGGLAVGAATGLIGAAIVIPYLDPLPTIPPGPIAVVPFGVVVAAAAALALVALVGGWLAARARAGFASGRCFALSTDGEAVRCEGIERVYRTPTGEVHALHDVTCRFPRGVVTAIVGPSGSGKSSLLRLIAGMDRPNSGSLVVEGRDVGRGSAKARRRLRRDLVGYIYQRPSDNFLAHLTVGEHLRLARRGRMSGALDPHRLLDLLDIGDRMDHLPSELSGGEQQRAAFAQAITTGAGIIVADEPTAELDDASSEGVLDRVRALAAEGVTFLLATHDPAVMAVADERFELEHGRVRGATHDAAHPSHVSSTPELRWPDPDGASWRFDDEPVVRLMNVDKTYGEGDEAVHALRSVSLEARAGEVVGLVGRSGSGKTTLLNVAAGWESPDAGTVTCRGTVRRIGRTSR